jgi:hypothetical protein
LPLVWEIDSLEIECVSLADSSGVFVDGEEI